MLTGFFTHKKLYHLKQRSTPWHIGSRQACKEQSALIIGGGLAGCFIAHCLARRNWNVTIIEEHDSVGKGASANQRAVLFPKLSAFYSPFTELMLTAFLYAYRCYSVILKQYPLGELNGALSLPYNIKEKNAQLSLGKWLSIYPSLGQLVNAKEATSLAGINISTDCLYIPYSGWIDSAALCHFLINDERISLVNQTQASSFLAYGNRWWVENHSASVLILANGYKVNQFNETMHLPVKPIRGQMTSILSTPNSAPLKIPVCAEGHVLPAINGEHYLGATYELGASEAVIKSDDDPINLDKLAKMAPDIIWSKTITGNWSGVRASTPDYMPLVGPIAKAEHFLKLYASLESNAKRWIAKEASYYPGLYAFAGFGSRGLTTIPLTAQWLAGLINNEFNGAPRHLMHALSPARFLRRATVRGL